MKISDKISKLLIPDEELLWSGPPDVVQSIAYSGWIWVVGTIFIFLGLMPPANQPCPTNPEIMVIFSGFYIALGIFTILISSVWVYLWARNSIYVITNKRLLVISQSFFGRYRTITILVCEPHNIESISVVQEIQHIGSVRILQQVQELPVARIVKLLFWQYFYGPKATVRSGE